MERQQWKKKDTIVCVTTCGISFNKNGDHVFFYGTPADDEDTRPWREFNERHMTKLGFTRLYPDSSPQFF